jgi:acetyltransferase-like isoleucine patch superfamily enzyme
MSSLSKRLKPLVPDGLKQRVLRARLRLAGRRVDFGVRARIDKYTRFAGPASLHAGACVFGCSVGRWTYFGDGSLAICTEFGAFCSVAPHVIVGGGRHPVGENVTTSPNFYSARDNPWGDFADAVSPEAELPTTYVGHDVWIGYAAVVLPGVRVGDGAVIGAGAVVTKDVEPYGIVTGIPARPLRSRFGREDVAWLRELKWWDWPDETLKRLRPAFATVATLRAAVGSRGQPVPVAAR